MADLDLEKFFAQVNHQRLQSQSKLEQKVSDRRLLQLIGWIERRLRLKVNASKSAVARTEERHFVGFALRREPLNGTVEVRLSKRSLDRIKANILALTPRNWGQSLRACIQHINGYLQGWIGFFWIVTDVEERTLQSLEAHIRRRLRAIVLRHWKRKRTIYRRLLKLGVRRPTAIKTLYEGNKSWWALSRCSAMHYGLNNAYFAELGLESVKQRWQHLRARHAMAQRQLQLPLSG